MMIIFLPSDRVRAIVAERGRPCVVVDVSINEMSRHAWLTPHGAEELAERLLAAAEEARSLAQEYAEKQEAPKAETEDGR